MDMCEVFSPPRLIPEAAKFGIAVGDAMDLTTGWGFAQEAGRRRAEAYVDKEKPPVLIGSPPCVAVSHFQALIPDSERKAKQLADGIKHVGVVARLYRKHIDAGRILLHEQPAHARSLALPRIRNIMRDLKVELVIADQCMFGLETRGKHKSQFVAAKNPTHFMTNSRTIGRELRRKCDRKHEHQPLLDGRAKGAARYPPALCRAICRGIM
ncbi:hypothetical protein N9L68_05505 [bacterium]|nr:hypothetical protein [bacterium]